MASPSVGMLVRLGDRCGIAEHSGYFFAHLSPGLAKSYAQDPYSKDHGALLSRLMADDVRLVHVQYETALFRDTPALARLLASYTRCPRMGLCLMWSIPSTA